MDLYSRKSRWKLYLAFAGSLIIIVSMLFTNYLAEKLKVEERKKVNLYKDALERLASETGENCDLTVSTNIITGNNTVPMILTDERDEIQSFVNYTDTSMANIKRKLSSIKASGLKPIVVEMQGLSKQLIYYQHSQILILLTYFPIFQFLLIACFIIVGYLLFSSARKSEQNQVWVGMAKETAHQLGTPISAIVGWIEHLGSTFEGDEYHLEIVNELRNDVTRLELIADRFSKIGSAPELKPANIYVELDECLHYMEKRASKKVVFEFPDFNSPPLYVSVNSHLFAWVIENIMRNALDAMDGIGSISAIVYEEHGYVCIDLSDSGKGIPHSKFKTIFEPGFTTKKRGWGLGLSLAKRIVESYHNGKLFVKRSELDKGTTFTIQLPKKV
jgi:signal transduction histidine kinase